VTISALATAGGTLVLALATFASVRSANAPRGSPSARYWSACVRSCCRRSSTTRRRRSAFVDDKWFLAGGGRGIAEADESAIYLAIPLRNVGSG